MSSVYPFKGDATSKSEKPSDYVFFFFACAASGWVVYPWAGQAAITFCLNFSDRHHPVTPRIISEEFMALSAFVARVLFAFFALAWLERPCRRFAAYTLVLSPGSPRFVLEEYVRTASGIFFVLVMLLALT